MTVATLFRGSEDYEAARRDAIWNGKKPNRFPDAIALAETEDDVTEAIHLAREQGWRIGIRSGGHSWVGNGIRDGGLLLDLSRLNKVTVDAETSTAAVGPGVRGPELQRALHDQGLYFPTGGCPGVAIAGFILGGGASFTSRKDGWACHSLRAIDVVTASGEAIHADDKAHPDLIWAARGGGPNFFAAITKLHLEAKPLPGAMYSSLYVYPGEVLDDFLDWNIELLKTTPPQVMAMWMAIESNLPNYTGTMLMHFPIATASSPDEAAALLEPFERSPLADQTLVHEAPHPYSFFDGYALVNELYVTGNRYRSDALWMLPSSPGFKDAIKDVIGSLPNQWSHFLWAPWNDSFHPNAAASLQTEVSVHPYGVCQDPEDDDDMMQYVAGALTRLKPHSIGGGMVNDCDLTAFPKDVLSRDAATRFEGVRGRYDPEGRFHVALGLEHE